MLRFFKRNDFKKKAGKNFHKILMLAIRYQIMGRCTVAFYFFITIGKMGEMKMIYEIEN